MEGRFEVEAEALLHMWAALLDLRLLLLGAPIVALLFCSRGLDAFRAPVYSMEGQRLLLLDDSEDLRAPAPAAEG